MKGATFEGVMDSISRIRTKSTIPIVIYAYMNPLISRGFENTQLNQVLMQELMHFYY